MTAPTQCQTLSMDGITIKTWSVREYTYDEISLRGEVLTIIRTDVRSGTCDLNGQCDSDEVSFRTWKGALFYVLMWKGI